MRNIGLLILGILWLLMGYKMCSDQTRCCQSAAAVVEQPVPAAPPVAVPKDCPRRSICFDTNSCEAYYGDDFEGLRDSLAALVSGGRRLLVTGIYSTSETYTGEYSNLGLCRAEVVKRRLSPTIDATLIDVNSEQAVGVELSEAEKVRFGITTAPQAEVPQSTLIYFPFNSTNKLDDRNVEAYLDQVAARVIASGDRVRLTGHTDSIGSEESNLALGRRRAQVIRDYLVSKGVNRNQILVETKGESTPITTNDTEEGRAKNRRTELQIIK